MNEYQALTQWVEQSLLSLHRTVKAWQLKIAFIIIIVRDYYIYPYHVLKKFRNRSVDWTVVLFFQFS